MENIKTQADSEARDRAKLRSQFRSVTGTSFVLVIVLALASWAGIIKPPILYVLFALIFIVDFSLHARLTWMHKVFFFTSRTVIQGFGARVASLVYALLALALLLFAIFSVTR